jgi:hypothetical protein
MSDHLEFLHKLDLLQKGATAARCPSCKSGISDSVPCDYCERILCPHCSMRGMVCGWYTIACLNCTKNKIKTPLKK